MESYEHILNRLPRKISFGSTVVHTYHSSEIEAGQQGYSVSLDGQDLSGEQDGDWRKLWLVIGYDEASGDPLFIDRSEKMHPVYTAVAGQGRWDTVLVADSLEGFADALAVFAAAARNRSIQWRYKKIR
jgi:hypothetical protein